MARRYKPRLNRLVRWTGTSLCLCIALIYIATSCAAIDASYQGDGRHYLGLWRGQVRLLVLDWVQAPGGSTEPRAERAHQKLRDRVRLEITPLNKVDRSAIPWSDALRFRSGWDGTGPFRAFEARLPLWIPFLPAAAITGLAFRAHQRARRLVSHCPSCNYNLSGLPTTSPCPECGAPPHSPPRSGRRRLPRTEARGKRH